MLLNTLLTTVLSSSKILHQCVTSRGSVTLGCTAIAMLANSKLSVGQSACDVYATMCDYLRCSSCDVAIVWNFGSWTLTVVIWKWLYHDTYVFYIKANSSDCPLSYRQHVVRCRCIQHSVQSNCCSVELSNSFLLSYDPVTVQLLLGVDYTL